MSEPQAQDSNEEPAGEQQVSAPTPQEPGQTVESLSEDLSNKMTVTSDELAAGAATGESAPQEPEAQKPPESIAEPAPAAAAEPAAPQAGETCAEAPPPVVAPEAAAESAPAADSVQQTAQVAESAGPEEAAAKCNLTLVLHEKLRMELEQSPLPPRPRPNEVQLATHTVGICGSDVKYWQCGKIADFVLTKPMILGHETSAVVLEVGDQVSSLKPGDRVAVEVGVPCAECQICRRGLYNLCARMSFAATPPHDGTLRRYFNHPANYCFKLPERVTLEEGALLEPLAVAVHACQRAPIGLDQVVLVCGAGAVGLLSMLSARAFGATHVIVTDISQSRLDFAKACGASETLLMSRELQVGEAAQLVRQAVRKLRPLREVDGVDVVLECSGAESSLQLALRAAALGSTIVCVGCQPDQVSIPLGLAVMQEVDIKGVFRYRNCYPLAMSLVEAGKIQLGPLITHRFKLEQSAQAFETCLKGEGVKILIKCVDEKQQQLANVK